MKKFRAVFSLRRLAVAAGLALAAWTVSGPGCAYFNTFYNAKKIYAEAEAIPRAKDGSVNPTTVDKYNEAIKKCDALIASYPKSKYVDDAILLIGTCLYQQGEYDKAIQRLAALDSVSTDAEVKSQGRLITAKSFVAKGEIESAVPIVQQLVDENPKKASDETLFLLGTTLVRIGKEDDAVKYLEQLARQYPRSSYRVNADLEAAEVYEERGEYEKSLALYDRLRTVELGEKDTIRYLSRLGALYAELGEYQKSIATFRELDRYVLDPVDKAANMLVVGKAYTGMDSIARAIDTFSTVAASYPRSVFSAEARFRLGEIYQDKLDSLQVAKKEFDEVPGQYANSPFAEEAISRSSAITKLLRLRESLQSGGEGDKAAVQYDLAEIELFQFKNYTKAIDTYQKVLDDYADSDLAPKAAYAIAYIYQVHLADSTKAKQAYEYVVARYPSSQQAQYARTALGWPQPEGLQTIPEPPMMQAQPDSTQLRGTTTAPSDTTHESGAATASPDTTQKSGAATAQPDTTQQGGATTAPPDTTQKSGTTGEKPDSTQQRGATGEPPDSTQERETTKEPPDTTQQRGAAGEKPDSTQRLGGTSKPRTPE